MIKNNCVLTSGSVILHATGRRLPIGFLYKFITAPIQLLYDFVQALYWDCIRIVQGLYRRVLGVPKNPTGRY